jgi:hypothetical protein
VTLGSEWQPADPLEEVHAVTVQQCYYVDGMRCGSLAETAGELSVALGLDVPWYGNLGALESILEARSWRDGQSLHIVWRHSGAARCALGYGETCRWLEERRLVWERDDAPLVDAWLAEAREGVGATLFDAIVAVMACAEGVELELA